MTPRETLATYAKEQRLWNGEHVLPWKGIPVWCSYCRRNSSEEPCPGPDFTKNTDALLRMAKRLYGYVAILDFGQNGGCTVDVCDPHTRLLLNISFFKDRYTADADYVNPIVDLQSALLAAIVAGIEALEALRIRVAKSMEPRSDEALEATE